jgi:hypothetical protein
MKLVEEIRKLIKNYRSDGCIFGLDDFMAELEELLDGRNPEAAK